MDVLASRLRDLHHADEPLLLPNAWDAASAARFAALGRRRSRRRAAASPARSASTTASRRPGREMLAAVARIAAAVDRAGDRRHGARLRPRAVRARGAPAGDRRRRPQLRGHRARRQRRRRRRRAAGRADRRARRRGAVVNARIDVYARKLGEPQTRLEEALRRAALYRDAGATCLFPILLDDEAELHAVRRAGRSAGQRPAARRAACRWRSCSAAGVARISVGSGLASAALDHAAAIAAALLAGNDLPLRGAGGDL